MVDVAIFERVYFAAHGADVVFLRISTYPIVYNHPHTEGTACPGYGRAANVVQKWSEK